MPYQFSLDSYYSSCASKWMSCLFHIFINVLLIYNIKNIPTFWNLWIPDKTFWSTYLLNKNPLVIEGSTDVIFLVYFFNTIFAECFLLFFFIPSIPNGYFLIKWFVIIVSI